MQTKIYKKNSPILYSQFFSIILFVGIQIILSWFLTVVQYEKIDIFGRIISSSTAYDIRVYLGEIFAYIDYIRAFDIKMILLSYGPFVTVSYSLPLILDIPLLFPIINGLFIFLSLKLLSTIDPLSKNSVASVLLNPYYLISYWGPSKDILALLITSIIFYIIHNHEQSKKSSDKKFLVMLLIMCVISAGIRANISTAVIGFIFFYAIKKYFAKSSKYTVLITLLFVSLIVYVANTSGIKENAVFDSAGKSFIPDSIQAANPFVKLAFTPVYLALYGMWDYVKPLFLADKNVDLVYVSLATAGILVMYSIILVLVKWKNFINPDNTLSAFILIYLLISIQNNYIHPRYIYPMIPCIFLISKQNKNFFAGFISLTILKLIISLLLPLTGQIDIDGSLPSYLPYKVFSFD